VGEETRTKRYRKSRGERCDGTKNTDARGCPRFVGRSIVDCVPRLRRSGDGESACRAARSTLGVIALLCAVTATGVGCTTVDPGSDFVIPVQTFDANYFYCYVEPQVLIAKSCGSGNAALGDPANGCHFNSSAVSGMALIQHPAIDCGGGDAPLDSTQVGEGSAAQSNLQAASFEMSQDPRQIFTLSDPVVAIVGTWATK